MMLIGACEEDMGSDIRKELGDNLRALMKESGIYQAKLAKILGVSDTAVSDWLKGKALPGAESIDKMVDELGWSKKKLIVGLDPDSELESALNKHNNSDSPFVIGYRGLSKRKG